MLRQKNIANETNENSNIDKHKNIDGCLTDLSSHFKKIEISPIYQSKAIGMDAEDFYNLVIKFDEHKR